MPFKHVLFGGENEIPHDQSLNFHWFLFILIASETSGIWHTRVLELKAGRKKFTILLGGSPLLIDVRGSASRSREFSPPSWAIYISAKFYIAMQSSKHSSIKYSKLKAISILSQKSNGSQNVIVSMNSSTFV